MAAKVLQFPQQQKEVRLTKEVLLPGKLYFDWDNPLACLEQARDMALRREISGRMLTWVTDQILERLIQIEESGNDKPTGTR
jgi:hypothetical protein